MKNEKYNSIFDNLTNDEFEKILKDCNFKFTKVDGKGGLYINGEQVTSHMLKEEYETFKMYMEYSHTNKYSKTPMVNVNNDNKIFDELEYYALAA